MARYYSRRFILSVDASSLLWHLQQMCSSMPPTYLTKAQVLCPDSHEVLTKFLRSSLTEFSHMPIASRLSATRTCTIDGPFTSHCTSKQEYSVARPSSPMDGSTDESAGDGRWMVDGGWWVH
ncbi:hypothetical protein BofuT4_P092930.1 [Botrytis cinerea T4]|uniref:Uncharacterized protein n=1 Tax=Botryotinia fuckeliana (strain T4) TaxID=999810 RepID=G2YE23_BOTF4|nr:hypothetical protein BofuT4_P092930.1 [Botrytis cinerea T4]